METAVYFICIALISYAVGTINFSKIVAWNMRRKDITKIGSKNPGTMNMLRSFGFGLAFLAFIGEVLKSGLLCLIFKFIIPNYGDLTYFLSGFFIILGYDYPAWNKFKGGKGVACFVGIFLFSSLWYVGIIWFAILFFLFIYIDYAFVMSFMYIGGMSIAYTIFVLVCGAPYAWAIILMIWALVAITVFKHRANIKRLATGNEKKIGFRGKLKKFFNHKKGEYIIDEENIEDTKPEKIIIVYDGPNPQNVRQSANGQNQQENKTEEKKEKLNKEEIDKKLYDEIMQRLKEEKQTNTKVEEKTEEKPLEEMSDQELTLEEEKPIKETTLETENPETSAEESLEQTEAEAQQENKQETNDEEKEKKNKSPQNDFDEEELNELRKLWAAQDFDIAEVNVVGEEEFARMNYQEKTSDDIEENGNSNLLNNDDKNE